MNPRTRVVVTMVLRAFRWLLWVVPLVVVAAAVIGGLVVASDGSGTSVWEHTIGPLHWFLFVVGILFLTGMFPTYVAFGVTRRRMLRGLGVIGGLLTALVALVITAGYLVERAILAGRGQEQRLRGDHQFDSVTEVHLVLAQYTLITAAFLVAGCLVGAAYYRYGGGRGTLALPLTVAPALVVGGLLGGNDLVGLLLGPIAEPVPAQHLAASVGLSLLTLIAAGLGLWLLTRRLTIRSGSPS